MGKTLSFPRKRESRSLKLLMSAPDWMPASAGMTNYDTVSCPSGVPFLDLLTGEGESRLDPKFDGRSMFFLVRPVCL
jgi:hypothetical protein